MTGGNLQGLLFLLNRPEPIRQSSLLMVLATGLGDSNSLLSGLKALAMESDSPWRDRITHLRILIEQGQTLSEALSSANGLVPEATLLAIRVGEQTGTLRQVLADEARQLMNESASGMQAQPMFSTTVAWTIVVGMIAMSLVSFIMIFIVPKYKKIFSDFDVDLPPLTNTLISISDFGADYWLLTMFPMMSCLLAASAFMVWAQLQRLSSGRIMFSEHFPRFWTPIMLRLLSITVAAGESLTEAVHCIHTQLRPGNAAGRLSGVRQQINAGQNCWVSLQNNGFLRRREVAFIESAAKTHHLDWGLIHLARTIDRRRDRWIQRLTTFVQPLVVLFVGLVVAFVCVAMFLPLIKLLNDLS
ncbi:MAG: type II secretion system F family protein [Fuerstiella sp.]